MVFETEPLGIAEASVCAESALGEAAWGELLAGFAEPIAILDASGCILAASEALAAVHGRRAGEIVRHCVREFLPPVVAAAVIDTVGEVVRDGRVRATVNMTRGHWWRRRYWRVTRSGGKPVCAVRCDPWRAAIMGGSGGTDPELVEIPDHDLADLATLSAREAEVLWLIGRGRSQIAIARELLRSPKTVETHTRSVSAKLRLRGRMAMAALAQERGLTMMTRDQVGRVFGRVGEAGAA